MDSISERVDQMKRKSIRRASEGVHQKESFRVNQRKSIGGSASKKSVRASESGPIDWRPDNESGFQAECSWLSGAQ